MKSIHVRLSDEEEAVLQERAKGAGKTVSEVVRECLFRLPEEGDPPAPVSDPQPAQLERQLSVMTKALHSLTARCAAHEGTETALVALSANVERLVDLLVEQKSFPFGMQLPFVQVAIMAVFALARGTFSHDPEAWEPYKEEARRRAFKGEGGDK